MKRKALFIGVNDYTDNQIRNLRFPIRDAHSMNDIFEEIGYEAKCLENPNKGDVFRAVREMTFGLSAGDQFLFYFAGHGFTDSGQHLLFCADDQHELLRFHRAGIPFDLLELETRAGCFDRSFLLDACQSDFFTGTRGEDATTRDLIAIDSMVPISEDALGSFYVLRSCSKYEHAIEIESRNHGLFTLAMMEVLRQSRRTGAELLFNDVLRETIREKMYSIARDEGMMSMQTPESDGRGPQQILMCGIATVPGQNDVHSELSMGEKNDEIEWQRMVHELVNSVTIFPHVKLGDGFAQYVVADDMSAVLICFWPSRLDVDDVVSDLEKVKVELTRTEPETLQEMVMFCKDGLPDNVAALRSRGIRIMDKPHFIAFIVDYFSEKNVPLRKGKIHFTTGEYDKSFKALEGFVKKGTDDPEAQYMIGYMYDHGKGVCQDKNEAESWYWKSAHQGYVKAIEVLEEKNNIEKARLLAEEDKIVAEIEEFTKKLLSKDADDANETAEDTSKNSDGLEAGAVKKFVLPGGATMEMVYCPPGEFMMGSPTTEEGRYEDETQHRVRLTNGFWMGKYPVTQAQWKSVMGNNPSRYKGDDHPVERVSWEECQEFIKNVNIQLNCDARLPTEAEWEYACRAGTTGAYGGTGNLNDMGWYCDNDSGHETHPVGQKMPNAWGLYDMHGNLWEWCNDWYDDYPSSSVTDPQGPATGDNRILRGGSRCILARLCRSAQRNSNLPAYREHSNSFGFRLCCPAGLQG